jgi:glycosyltransferase involved in cell wall biosynthesis
MRIGFDAKRFFHNKTGLGNYSRSLVKLLSDANSENDYLLFNPKHSRKFSLHNYSSKVVEVLPSNFLFKKVSSLWRLVFISNDIKKNSVEIYHGLSGELPIGLLKKIKKVVTIHDLIFIRYPNLYGFFDRKIYYWKFKYAAKKADVVIAISEQTKKDIVDFLSIDSRKIKVIYQGCQDIFKKQYSLEEKDIVAKKYTLPGKFILNVGTIEERKNLFTIVKSIKDLDIPLVIIGKKTSYYNQIHQYILENGMEKRVFYLSKLEANELAIIYQLATIFIYPSIFEGFGIPIIEALFSKTPVITTISGVFPEAGGPDSVYIDPMNVEELKEKIIMLMDNDELRKDISEKGFQFVQKFNNRPIAEQMLNCYRELL